MKKLIVFYLLFALTGSSCSLLQKSSSQSQEFEQLAPAHNSRNSLDWNGTYRGILPCADCRGIKTEIILDNDLNYTLLEQYIEKSDSVYRKNGTFSWNDGGTEITLNVSDGEPGTKHFFVGENVLIMLDFLGNKIESELSEYYELSKPSASNEITNIYWKLIELFGQEIQDSNEGEREPHLILRADDSRATGNTGCNVFTGSYELIDNKRINFSSLASTRMFCRDVDYEDDFLIMFDRAKSYKKLDDSLQLYDAEDSLIGVFVWDFFNTTLDLL